MYKTHFERAKETVTWRQFARRGYSAFASLKRQVRIGVLSAATLGVAAQAEASLGTSPVPSTRQEDEHEERLEEVTVSGTMAPLTELQSARIVGVLSRQEIERAGVQSINDLLKLATGMDVRQRGGFGVQTDVSIDGGTFDQMTLLLNGVNVSNPHTGHLSMDLPVSIDDIERIEVLEGAASRVYGATAFGGAINVVTRKASPEPADKSGVEGSATARAGSFGTFQASGRIGLAANRLANTLSGGGGRSNGGTMNSDWRRGQIYYQGEWQGDALSLNWQAGMSRKAYGANTFYSAAYPNQYERNERWLMSVGAETKGRFHLTPNVYWNRTYDNFELVRGERFGENFHQGDVYGLRVGGYFNWKLGRTAVGTELRQEGILSTNLGRDLEETQYVKVRNQDSIYYARQDDRTLVSYNIEHNIVLDHWTISAGVLANMATSVNHRFRFYPGVDVAWRPCTQWKVFASYNKGFRLPTFTELYYKSATHEGNKGLRPEENHSIQVGMQYRRPGLTGTLRGFYHRGRQMIDWVMYNKEDTYHSTAFNLDNLGVQTEVKMDFTPLIGRDIWVQSLSIGYTYIHQERHDDVAIFKSNYALEYLRHKIVASLNHRIWDRLSANWSVRWQDRMGSYLLYYTDTTMGYLRGLNSGNLVNYHPYATLDVKLLWRDHHYDLFVQGTNITDHRYYDLGNVPQPGICILAGGTVRF